MKSTFILLSSALLISAAATAQHSVSTNGQKHVLIHEGTGTWCGWCVDGALVLDELTSENPKVIGVAVHDGDAMAFSNGNTFNNTYAEGFPYGTVDLHFFSSIDTTVGLSRGDWGTAAEERLALSPDFDVMMTQNYDKASKTVTVVVTGKSLKALTGDFNINAYIVEDSVTGTGGGYDQKNFYPASPYTTHPYYTKPNPIKGYVHMKVLRAMLGGVHGTSAFTAPAANTTVSKTFTYVIPDETKATRYKIVGLVQKSGSNPKKDRDVMNAVQARFMPWSTSVSEIAAGSNVTVYPNPAQDMITVTGSLTSTAPATVALVNAVGQTVYSQVVNPVGNKLNTAISVGNLSNGIYMIHVTSDGAKSTAKVVISK